jgi:hypothetical protein
MKAWQEKEHLEDLDVDEVYNVREDVNLLKPIGYLMHQ